MHLRAEAYFGPQMHICFSDKNKKITGYILSF